MNFENFFQELCTKESSADKAETKYPKADNNAVTKEIMIER